MKLLKQKLLAQEYPEVLINEQFERVLKINRADLLFRDQKTKKKRRPVICPLVTTYNEDNPPFKRWIEEELPGLHQCPEMATLTPYISARHWRGGGGQGDPDGYGPVVHRSPGNFRFHNKNCVTCKRMTDGQSSYTSSKTSRQYTITRHYTCQSRWLVYLVTCTLCPDRKQYIGQTIRSLAERHRNHRTEIRTAADGLGEHFHGHLVDMGFDPRADVKNIEKVVPFLDLAIIASVNPNTPGAQERLNKLEADFQHRLMTMNVHGGMNLRDESRRTGRK